MAQVLRQDKIGTLSHSSGAITLQDSVLTVGGQQYATGVLTRTISDDVTLAANTLYYIYGVVSSGVPALRISANNNNLGPSGFSSWKLLGGFYTDGASAVVNLMLSPLVTDSEVRLVTPREDVELFVHTGDGHGSTNTRVRRMSTVTKQTGNGVYYNYDHAARTANGLQVTILVPGLYSVSYSDGSSTGFNMGISINAPSPVTTSMGSGLTVANGKRANAGLVSGTGAAVSGTYRLNAGDIVRPHTDGGANATSDSVQFQLIRVED